MAYTILIIKTGALGDVLRTTFLLEGLRKKHPDCHISWLTSPKAKPLLENNDAIDHIYTKACDLPGFFNLVLSLDDEEEEAKAAASLKKDKLIGAFYDGEVQYTEDSSAWFGMGLLRPENMGGIAEANRLKKENRLTFQEIIAGICKTDYDSDMPILNLTDKDKLFRDEFRALHNISGQVIGLNTGSGGRWKLKRWDESRTAALASLFMRDLFAKVILLGGEQEKERNQRIAGLSGIGLIDSGTQNTLRQFAAIVDLCDIIVTSDTLAMHIALALKKKVIVLVGSTSITEIELYGLGSKVYPEMPCLCCYKRKCNIRPNCMDNISVDRVYKAVSGLL